MERNTTRKKLIRSMACLLAFAGVVWAVVPAAAHRLTIEPAAASLADGLEQPGFMVDEATITPTPIPAKYLAEDSQTDGILFAAVLMLVVVLGGTLAGMRRRKTS